MAQENTIKIADCPISSVQVYNDRAEVNRNIPLDPRLDGRVKITLTGLVDCLNESSLRVKGNHNAKILDVQSSRVVDKDKDQEATLSGLIKKREELQVKISENKGKFDQLDKEKKFVDLFVTSSFQRVENQPPKTLEETKEILSFQKDESQRLMDEERDLAVAKKALLEALEVVEDEIRMNGGRPSMMKAASTNNKWVRKVTLSIDATAAAGGEGDGHLLRLTYIVNKASWRPSYDMRISTEKGTCQMTYYGELRQNSGEDWKNCDLRLSTAKPSVGATPKPVQSIEVRHRVFRSMNMMNMRKGGGGAAKMMSAPAPPPALQSLEVNQQLSDEDDYEESASVASFEDETHAVGAEVKAGGDSIAAAFTIPQKSDILSTGQPSKVVIADLSFKPQIIHYTAPTTGDLAVYLQAKTLNDSPYLMLSSDLVSIFVDGAFISTSSVKQTPAGQNFFMYLGVDPSVKCTRKPVKAESRAATGWTSGSTMVKEFLYLTSIHNQKANNIKVLVADALPKSNDEKIVVDVLLPKPSSIKKMALASESGLANLDNLAVGSYKDDAGTKLMWVLDIAEGKKEKIEYNYAISYPKTVDLELHSS